MVLCCGDNPVAVVLCTRRSGEVMPHVRSPQRWYVASERWQLDTKLPESAQSAIKKSRKPGGTDQN